MTREEIALTCLQSLILKGNTDRMQTALNVRLAFEYADEFIKRGKL